MVYIIHPSSNLVSYILQGLGCEYKEIILSYKNPFMRFEYYCMRKSIKLPMIAIRQTLRKMFRHVTPSDSVITWGQNDLSILRLMKNTLPKETRTMLWQWNPYDKVYASHIQEKIEDIKAMGFYIATFDESDALKYNIKYLGQIFRFVPIENTDIDYDFYFIGAAKNRIKLISEIKDKLSKYRLHFYIANSQRDYISYSDNLKNVFRSKCIIDINQIGQKGLSLRPVEAMFCNRKLVTNNLIVDGMDFYDPNNVFIIGKDSWGRLDEFIETPYKKIDKSILKKYDINTWLKNILEM